MIPFCGKKDSGHKPGGPRSRMCKEGHQRSTTNFPPIAEYNRPTSPAAQRQGLHQDMTRCEPPPPRPIAGARPRSNSNNSPGDIWSSGRRSICSSNGRSSQSLSSGDASTVASTEKLWRRRKLSPRRVISRPVTPFPEEDISNILAAEAEHEPRILAPSPPHQTKSTKPHVTDQPRSRARFSLSQKHQPIAEEQSTAVKITSLNRAMRKADECCLERKPHPPSQQHKEAETAKTSERRRRKSMPEIYGRPKGEVRKADTVSSKKTEGRVLGEIMDCVMRERIVNWLSEVAYAKIGTQDVSSQEELSCIDEE